MAHIKEELVVIKLSRISKDGEDTGSAITEELITTLEGVAQELVGNGVIVEIELGDE